MQADAPVRNGVLVAYGTEHGQGRGLAERVCTSLRRGLGVVRARASRGLLLLACMVLALLAGAIGPLSASAALSWSAPVLIDHQRQYPAPGGLSGVSCPSTSLCVAVDRAGNVVTSTRPTGRASAWTIAHVDPTSSSGCVMGSCHGLTDVSCASAVWCVAVDDQGNAITSSNPTGGRSAWRSVNIDSRNAGCGYTGLCYGLTGVSCPSGSLCVAVDAVGNVLTSTHPGGGASAWRTANVDGHRRSAVPAADVLA